jgi:hypothetical protein
VFADLDRSGSTWDAASLTRTCWPKYLTEWLPFESAPKRWRRWLRVAAVDMAAAAICFTEVRNSLFGQYHRAGKLRRECFSGGKVLKAPSNVVVLIVSAARNMVIGDSALTVKGMHVV